MIDSPDNNQLIEPLKLDITGNKDFITNKVSEEFKKKYFKLVNGVLSKKKKFLSAEIGKAQDLSLLGIIVMIFFCITFYLLLITVFVSGDKTSILFLILIYILGSLVQISIVPIPMFYYSRLEFENELSKVLNCSMRLTLNADNSNKKVPGKKEKIDYPGNYVFDITGVINIPKSIGYVKIDAIQYYLDSEFFEFRKQYNRMNGSSKIKRFVEYNNQPLNYKKTYDITSSDSRASVTFLNTLLCILLLQWIYSLIFRLNSADCVTIYPAKLILKENNYQSTTRITVHGNTIKSKDYEHLNIDPTKANELQKEYTDYIDHLEQIKKAKEEKERKNREKKEQKKRELKENTTLLSTLDNNNYYIKVKKIYNDVYAYITVYNKDKNLKEKIYLGTYDPEAEEEIDDEGEVTSFYPKGHATKIQIISQEYKYIIKVGTKFSKSYYYYDNS